MAVIDVRDLGKRYRRGRRQWAEVLADVDLRVQEGSVLGLLGPNGAGKTTLIKILCGLLAPDAGSGTVLGHDIRRSPAAIRARVSLVAPTADVGIDNNLTVRQNLVFWAPVFGLRGAEARRRIDALLERLDLVGKADAWPMHISAGQRQRLALARSLLAENRLVFLDEPTNKLDSEGVRSVRSLITDLNRGHGVTVVLTTHVMEEAEELCDEIALLRQGRLVASGGRDRIVASLGVTRPIAVTFELGPEASGPPPLNDLPGALQVRLERAPGEPGLYTAHIASGDVRATTPALLSWVRAHGLRLRAVQTRPVTLEDVFLSMTESTTASTTGAARAVE